MEEIKITISAFNLIQHECLRCEVETGGLLIGTLNNLIVLEATPPGDKARSTFTSFSSDAEYDRLMLNKTIEKFEGRVKLIGYWHKHPGTLAEPSLGDMKQAQELVKDIDEDKDDRPLLILIINIVQREIQAYAYDIRYGSRFSPFKISVIEDNSNEIQQALKNEPAVIQTRDVDFWTDLDFQFYLTQVGKERIKHEVDELNNSGYDVKVLRNPVTKRLYLEIIKYKMSFICFPPVEYPLNPPKILINKHPIMLPIQYWNSDCSIKQVLDIILKKTLSKAKPCIKETKVRDYSLSNKVIKATLGYLKAIRKILIRGSR